MICRDRASAQLEPLAVRCGAKGRLLRPGADIRVGIVFVGLSLVNRFEWIFYVFGALLILSGIKMVIVCRAPLPSVPVIVLSQSINAFLPVVESSPELPWEYLESV